MASTTAFLSVQNFKMCCEIFDKYMEDVYGFKVGLGSDKEMKKSMFDVMHNVSANAGETDDMKRLNNAVLNEMRDICLAKFNMTSGAARKPRVRNLERDKEVYGTRELNIGEHMKPMMNPPRRDEMGNGRSVDDIASDRDRAIDGGLEGRAAAPLPFEVVKVDSAPSTNDFMAQLEAIEKRRALDLPPDQPQSGQSGQSIGGGDNARLDATFELSKIQQGVVPPDPKQMYSLTTDDRMNKRTEQAVKSRPYENFAQDALIAPARSYEKKTYILFNGYDRNWEQYPLRYNFTLDMADTAKTLRNIVEIAFTRLIVPMEILQNKKLGVVAAADSPYYNQYGLTYPYLTLQVDQLSPGMYEGFNKTTQKSFTSFVFHREYRASNGRGFIIMQPLQDEKKEYVGAPLSSLPRLTMRIVKPNGTLYNMARDENRLDFLLYEAMNPLLVRIVCKDYFDINEYAAGDVVRIKGFKTMTSAEFEQAVQTAGAGPVSSADLSLYSAGVLALDEFMNREEGHEVINIGERNQNAFLNTFSVFLPRILDKAQGAMVIQKNIFDTINVCQQYLQKLTPYSNADVAAPSLLNMTLQVVLTMKVKTRDADVSHVFQSVNV